MPINAIGSVLDVNPLVPGVRSNQGLALPIPKADGDSGMDISGSKEGPQSFGQLLTKAIADVNQAQVHAGDMTARFAAGDRMDVHQLMIASQEASVSLNLAIQVRNKLVDAYQEILRVNM